MRRIQAGRILAKNFELTHDRMPIEGNLKASLLRYARRFKVVIFVVLLNATLCATVASFYLAAWGVRSLDKLSPSRLTLLAIAISQVLLLLFAVTRMLSRRALRERMGDVLGSSGDYRYPRRFWGYESTRHLGHIRLWREELEEIDEVFRNNIGKPRIEVGFEGSTYSLLTFDSLITIPGLAERESPRLEFCVVSSSDRRAVVFLSPTRATLTLAEPSPAFEYFVRRIVQSNRRFGSRTFWSKCGVLALAISFLLVHTLTRTTFFSGAHGGGHDIAGATIAAEIIGTTGIFVASLIFARYLIKGGAIKSSAIIFAKKRAETPRWLQRNRHVLVSAIVGAIVTLVFLVIGIVIEKILS